MSDKFSSDPFAANPSPPPPMSYSQQAQLPAMAPTMAGGGQATQVNVIVQQADAGPNPALGICALIAGLFSDLGFCIPGVGLVLGGAAIVMGVLSIVHRRGAVCGGLGIFFAVPSFLWQLFWLIMLLLSVIGLAASSKAVPAPMNKDAAPMVRDREPDASPDKDSDKDEKLPAPPKAISFGKPPPGLYSGIEPLRPPPPKEDTEHADRRLATARRFLDRKEHEGAIINAEAARRNAVTPAQRAEAERILSAARKLAAEAEATAKLDEAARAAKRKADAERDRKEAEARTAEAETAFLTAFGPGAAYVGTEQLPGKAAEEASLVFVALKRDLQYIRAICYAHANEDHPNTAFVLEGTYDDTGVHFSKLNGEDRRGRFFTLNQTSEGRLTGTLGETARASSPLSSGGPRRGSCRTSLRPRRRPSRPAPSGRARVSRATLPPTASHSRCARSATTASTSAS